MQLANCPLCGVGSPLAGVDTPGRFALDNLFAAGTITLTVHGDGAACDNATNNNLWLPLPTARGPCDKAMQDDLLRGLTFLSENLFLHATCRPDPGGQVLFIRIYLIPADLPNARGQLHCRSNKVMKEGRRYLQDILPFVSQNPHLWNAEGHDLSSRGEYFLPRNIVCAVALPFFLQIQVLLQDNRTMAEIYNDLDSPTVPDDCVSLARQIASGKQVWELRSQLYGYQRRSIAVMIEKELNRTPVQDPSFVKVCGMRGEKYFFQPSSTIILCECPMVSTSRGGLLCEELGLYLIPSVSLCHLAY